MRYPRSKLELRKLSDEDIARVVEDYAARMEAREARRRADETMRTTLSLSQHSERTGVSMSALKQLVAGWTYKDVISQIAKRVQ